MAKTPNIVFEGKTVPEYTITQKGIIRSIHGNKITVTDGRATITIDGKRRRLKVADILNETYPPAPKKSVVRKGKNTPINETAAKVIKGKTTSVTPEQVAEVLAPEVKKEEEAPDVINLKEESTIHRVIKEAPKAEAPKEIAPIREHRGPIYVSKTTNASFLKVSEELKAAGIKNHEFMLWLTNPALEGVNPHNPALPKNARAAVVKEAIENPWYFFRECVRVETTDGKLVPFPLTRETATLLYLALRGESVYYATDFEQSAEVAMTALLAYTSIAESDSVSNILSVSTGYSNDLLKNVLKIVDTLPITIRRPIDKKSIIQMGKGSVEFLNKGTKIAVRSTPVNAGAASAIARSVNGNIQWFANFEFFNHSVYLLRETESSFRKIKKSSISTSAQIITTRINENPTKEDYVGAIIAHSVPWRDHMLDATWEEYEDLLEGTNGFFYLEGNVGKNTRLIPQEKYQEEETTTEPTSKFEWYKDRIDIISQAITLYDTLDRSLHENNIPAIVLQDIKLDGREDNIENAEMVRAYGVRRTAQILVEAVHIDPRKAYDDIADTLYANFGTNSANAVTQLLKTNSILMGRYYNLVFKCLELVDERILLRKIAEAGQLTAESLHLMLNAVKDKY